MNLKKISKIMKGKRKKVLIRSLLLTCLLLGTNTFAWFIFIDKFSGDVSANVISWDVTFYDEDTQMDQVALVIDDLVPGMDDYQKVIKINNNSDVEASFSYEVISYEILGQTYTVGNDLTNEQAIQNLKNQYPFTIDFNNSKDVLDAEGDYANFNIIVTWPYESSNDYYRINNTIEYSSAFEYYSLANDIYTIDTTVNESNYLAKVNEGLYVDSDVIDTYWGKLAANYKKNNPTNSCLNITLKLIVTQQN